MMNKEDKLILTCKVAILTILVIVNLYAVASFFAQYRCTNYGNKEIESLCRLYELQIIEGSLCPQICSDVDVIIPANSNYPTNTYLLYNETNGRSLLLKSMFSIVNFYQQWILWDFNATSDFSAERIYWAVADTLEREKLTLFKNNEKVNGNRLVNFRSDDPVLTGLKESVLRKGEILTLWTVLQQPEFIRFLKASNYVNFTKNMWLISNNRNLLDYYPRIQAVCGPYYGVDYIAPLSMELSLSYQLMSIVFDMSRRLKLAVSLTKLAAKLDDTSSGSVFHGCGVTMDQIASTDDDRLIILNSAKIVSQEVLVVILKKQRCFSNEDCQFLHCNFVCNTKTELCDVHRVESNLQIFCRELFPHIFNNFQRKFNTEVKGILHACSSGNYNDLSGRFARLEKILNEENKITFSELE
ncbi:divergent protein kinase domain 1C-like [Clavelina lepadiformis]|uniref:divergent protein kinase domain 1C-like n=1 Tax=Clavelina lepadiformis TaxID=159417 RepID=UPI0040424FF3